MAIDTRTKRGAMLGLARPISLLLTEPDGAVPVSDRATFAFLYPSDGLGSVSSLTWGLELELDGPGNGWTDVSAHVSHEEPLVCAYGITGSDPSDRVASAGTLRFALHAPDQAVGYYSPFHVNRRPGFDFNIGVRFWLWFGGTRQYKHRGHLADIHPEPGLASTQAVHCQSLDWMDDAARQDVPDLEAETGKRADELITLVLDGLDTQPVARALDTGVGTFAYAFDGGSGQRLKAREELIKIALSEQGYIYVAGDPYEGGTLVFEARGHRTLAPVTLFTFNDDMNRDGLTVVGGRDDVPRTVQVVVHPAVVDASHSVLFKLETTELVVHPGETIDTVFGPYRDPDTNEPCGGVDLDTPTASTDYTMNTAQDGSGTDLTADFTVTAVGRGDGVRYAAITNGSASVGYVTKLWARAKRVKRTEVMIEKTIAGGYGDRTLRLDLPYGTSVNTAQKIATQLAALLASPVARVRSVRFLANVSDDFLAAAVEREPGDRIEISESVTGLAASLFTIHRPTYTIERGSLLTVDWELVPWGLDAWWAPSGFEATGGTITEVNGYTVHTFTSSGTFEIVSGSDITVNALIVGGGGPGGGDDLNSSGGGGGAGGRVRTLSATLGVGTYAVVVGDGGAFGDTSGDPSSFNGTTAEGGSRGGGGGADGAGGTLGGGGGADDSTYVGAGGDGSLFDGGTGGSNGGGGGAGAGGNGGAAPGFNIGGHGGAAVSVNVAGVLEEYGGGGSGAAYATPGTPGAGGGAGATFAGGGAAGTANRGGGGGGGRFGNGGAGGKGVVKVWYPTPA